VGLQNNEAYRGNNNYKNNGPMSLQQWRQLTPEAQITWDLHDDVSKPTIIEKRAPQHGNKHDSKPHSVNLHEMTAYDYFNANLHDSHIGGDSTVIDDSDAEIIRNPEPGTSNMSDNIQANKTKKLAHATKLPPGDISRLRSTKMSKTQQDKPAKITTLANQSEIMVNGVKY
jgi:hypothetical protein